MLEDIKRTKANEAEQERRRLDAQESLDRTVRASYANYLPVLDAFCRESGWALEDHGFVMQSANPFISYDLRRRLHVFISGPKRICRGRDYSSEVHAGLHFFIWLDGPWLFRWHSAVQCATYCTALEPYDSIFYKSWTGDSRARLEASLRGAFGLFG